MLKCARCGRVFPAPGQSPPTRSRPKSPSRDQNLSFAFDDDDDEWRAPELAPEDLSEERLGLNDSDGDDASDPEPPPRKTSLRSSGAASDAPSVDPDLPPARSAAPPRPQRGDVELLRDEDDFEIDDGAADDERAYALQGGGISVRSVFVFLALIVCGYGALTWTLLDDPDWSDRLTQTLPLIGKEVRERTVGQEVALIDVSGRYERTKEGRLVFVVTGKAVNHSAESLRGVQIMSKLYGPADKTLDEQITACGNPMEAKISDLSIHQAAILRSIKPPPDFTVQPGGECPFVAIFLEVSGAVDTFSTEVLRARRQA